MNRQTQTTMFGREPVMILAAVEATIALAVGFGAPVSGEQVGLLMAFVAAAIGLLARARVSPID